MYNYGVMQLLFLIVLWIHAFTAVFFIGGSFFIWMVVWPMSYKMTEDERERTRIVGLIGRLFGTLTDISVIILLVTGAYLGMVYLPQHSDLMTTVGGQLLLAKSIIVIIMIVLMYANNLYHGKRIVNLAAQGKLDEVKRIRRITHIASFITLGLLAVIAILAFTLPFYAP